MRYDHRGFDQTDPDATQALQDALPIVANLLNERLKPQPKDIDLLRAWRESLVDLREQLEPLAARAGCTANELEKIAEVELKQAQRAMPPASFPTAPAEKAPPTFGELAMELGKVEAKLAELDRERKPVLKRHAQLRRALFKGGRKRLGS